MTKTKKTKATKSPSTKRTYVAFIVDRSGSMHGLEEQVISGVNKQIKSLQDADPAAGEYIISLIKFDDVVDVMQDNVRVHDMPEFTAADYVPRNGTALNDAIWTGIKLLEMKDKTEDTAYLMCVLSDGAENASKEISLDVLQSKITQLQETKLWTFTYMIANMNVNTFSATYGVSTANINHFAANSAGTAKAYNVSTNSLGSYATLRGSGRTSTDTFYDSTTK